MTGVYDCHIHMALDGADWRAATARFRCGDGEEAVRRTLEHYRALGFTYLRDGGDKWGAGELAAELAEEYGITYRTPCFPICRKGHYGKFLGRSYESREDYRALLRRVRERGGHFIKLMLSGIMDFDCYGVVTGEPLPVNEIRMLIGEAHDAGFAVMAHANGDAAVSAAAEAGVDSVEHGAYLSEETLCALAECGAVWVPTIAPVADLIGTGLFSENVLRRIVLSQNKNIRRAEKLGIPIACGSDGGAFGVPHAQGSLRERELLGEALGENAETILQGGLASIQAKF